MPIALRGRALSAIERLPRMSVGSARLLAALAMRDVEVKELVRIVQVDPLLAAHVLQIANSGAFGRRQRIESIPHAVAFLGPSTLRRYVLRWMIFGMFKRLALPKSWSTARFTMHSGATALLTDVVADRLPLKNGDAAYPAGLLHDIGKFVIAIEAPDALDLIAKMRETGDRSVTECEREALGIDHAEISSIAAEKWRLSEEVCRAIQFHHEPERDSNGSGPSLSLVLARADAYVNGQGLTFLSSPRDANPILHLPGHEHAVNEALKSFETAPDMSSAEA